MAQQATSPKEGSVAFAVPPLPYAFDALEPYIDKLTMEIHHDKHHGAYVTNLNKALEGHADLQALTIEELVGNLSRVPEAIRGAVRNNGGGHWNHSLFWTLMQKADGGEPTGKLADAIKAAFGDFGAFKEKFAAAGLVPDSVDVVIMNPPFNDASRHRASPDRAREVAHVAAADTLEGWIHAARRILKSGGHLAMIWRADGLAQVLAALNRGFGGLVILPAACSASQGFIHGRMPLSRSAMMRSVTRA